MGCLRQQPIVMSGERGCPRPRGAQTAPSQERKPITSRRKSFHAAPQNDKELSLAPNNTFVSDTRQLGCAGPSEAPVEAPTSSAPDEPPQPYRLLPHQPPLILMSHRPHIFNELYQITEDQVSVSLRQRTLVYGPRASGNKKTGWRHTFPPLPCIVSNKKAKGFVACIMEFCGGTLRSRKFPA